MSKWKILPRMAVKGVMQNGTVYYPYLMAGVFSVFTYFIFASILGNDLVATLPHSAYAWMILLIGKGLLGIILIPFLFYANSFLIKRRTKEVGLYSILGLEKRHIGVLLSCETILIYLAVISGGIILGTVLSKLLFLLLLKLSGLPVEAEFLFTWEAFMETILFFGLVFAINLVYGLIQVGKAKPVELFSGSRKGEKEPKLVWFYAVLGALVLGAGYAVSIRSQLDEMIFIDFFLAVFLVVVGTYLLFTSGSVLVLRMLKRSKKFYYQKENFITVSGMLYRMKKNAAGLANICIFSTMVVITLVCTTTLYGGIEEITHYNYPYDIVLDFASGNLTREQIEEEAGEILGSHGKQAVRMDIYDFRSLACRMDGNHIGQPGSEYRDNDNIYLLTLEDYNQIEGENHTLSEGQVLFYSNGGNLG
ncbi:MAG: FtsX-like permease family protein, partial [Lachnospiraceae bacterium]|nr:FtsX-like permease family protein [Lachnospiraceae bacterium]